jgi:hypothetical protein
LTPTNVSAPWLKPKDHRTAVGISTQLARQLANQLADKINNTMATDEAPDHITDCATVHNPDSNAWNSDRRDDRMTNKRQPRLQVNHSTDRETHGLIECNANFNTTTGSTKSPTASRRPPNFDPHRRNPNSSIKYEANVDLL